MIRQPSSVSVAGPSGRGKSELVEQWLRYQNVFQVKRKTVVYAYDRWQPRFDRMQKKDGIRFHRGLPDPSHLTKEERRTGLFADYVNTWLKLKQESAGCPRLCQTVEQKREYILRYQEREGIRLDISQIAKNPGRKATAGTCFIFFFFHVVIPPLLVVSFFSVSGANLVSGSTNPPPSPSRTLPICSV